MNATTPLVAVNFPGQGSQVKDMGRDLAEADDRYMYYWTLAENISRQPLRESTGAATTTTWPTPAPCNRP
jgi:[acyl-carrier-protein] S-malonyltransferase